MVCDEVAKVTKKQFQGIACYNNYSTNVKLAP